MELIKLYSDLIIMPLEKEVRKIREKVYNKSFSFTRKKDKEYLEKMEKLLLDYYEKFSIFIEAEIKFNNEIKNQLTKKEK